MANNQSPMQSVITGIAFVLVSFIIVWDTDIMNIISILFAVLGTMLLTTGTLRLMARHQPRDIRKIIELKKDDFNIFSVKK